MKKAVLITLIVIVVLAGCGLAFYHTGLYTNLEKSRIEKQLEKTYGTAFEVDRIDEPQSLFPNFGASQGFVAYSKEGIFALGECDWKGTVLNDTYCHYFYAPVLNLELQNILGDCFKDFYIVRDCFAFGGNKAAADLIEVNESANADTYTAKIDRKETCFRVYVTDTVTEEQLQLALDRLADKKYEGNVYFIAVSEELFTQLKNSCMDCYFAFSSLEDALAKYVTCIDRQALGELIGNPGKYKYIVAQYVPKYGTSEILDSINDTQ